MTDLFAPPSTSSLRRPLAILRADGATLDVVAAVVELGLAPATNAAALTRAGHGGAAGAGRPAHPRAWAPATTARRRC